MNNAKDRDLELWLKWNTSKSTADLEALLLHMRPLIYREANRWANVVNKTVLEAEANKLAVEAFKTYDPKRSPPVQLSTHVTNRLLKLSRVAYERQSTVSIPEHQRLSYNKLNRLKGELEDRLGKPPTIEHLADHMSMSVPKIQALIANVEKRELMESGEGPVFQQEEDRMLELIELAYSQFTPRQKEIYDYRTGSHGKPETKNPAIMAKLNISQGVLSYEIGKITEALKRLRSFA